MSTKTTATNRNLFGALFVLAAIGGYYFLRRRGYSMSDMIEQGTEGVQKAREYVMSKLPGVDQADTQDEEQTSQKASQKSNRRAGQQAPSAALQ